jgi:hypothetical protein
MIILSPNLLLSTNELRHCIFIVKLPYITSSLHTCHVNCKSCDLPPLNHTTPIMKYDNLFLKLALIHKPTLPLHFYGKPTLYNLIASHLPCNLQILRPTNPSSLNHTTPIMKYDNLSTNFALIYKWTLPLHLYGKTALCNTIAIHSILKLQMLHRTYSSILPLPCNMIIFLPTLLLSINGLYHCISTVKLPYITPSLHTLSVNYKCCTLPILPYYPHYEI